MPEVSSFFGIIIRMYYREHNPPHFHAEYAGEMAEFDITSFDIVEGQLSPRAERLVREWAGLHQNELIENWDRARRAEQPRPIAPLE